MSRVGAIPSARSNSATVRSQPERAWRIGAKTALSNQEFVTGLRGHVPPCHGLPLTYLPIYQHRATLRTLPSSLDGFAYRIDASGL